ncbi:MAG: diacylglycerol kinase family lipid kinase [Candidatus Dormibacteraeota bacterium]|nr:diacylglycerol kinase family lipid kinase [Candidatus Dormibacteraeota bacterium]
MAAPLLIVNPAAGAGRVGREWPALAAGIRAAGIALDEAFTTRPGEATEIARREVRAGRPVVAAVGGDGTLNEVANGFFEGGAALPTTSNLGLIPFGTGGDTRRTFNIPDGVLAARVLLEGRPRTIDAGRVDIGGRTIHFVNIAEAGLGALVSDRVNRAPKKLGGKISFLLGTLGAMAAWKHQPMRVVVDGIEVRELVAQSVTVANCRYYGGGMLAAPMAVPDDGLLDVIITGAIGKRDGLLGLAKIYGGKHFDDPRLSRWVETFRARRVEVESSAPVLVQVEGEVAGRLPATFEVLPGALRLMVPA